METRGLHVVLPQKSHHSVLLLLNLDDCTVGKHANSSCGTWLFDVSRMQGSIPSPMQEPARRTACAELH
eukprot:1604251-Amphidinium_carterae.1